MSDITKELCNWCGEETDKGIFRMISHSCLKNTVIYRSNSSTLRKLLNLFNNKTEGLKTTFDKLLDFKHFQPFKERESTHVLDEILYRHARDFELKQMKRIIKLYKAEELLDSKY